MTHRGEIGQVANASLPTVPLVSDDADTRPVPNSPLATTQTVGPTMENTETDAVSNLENLIDIELVAAPIRTSTRRSTSISESPYPVREPPRSLIGDIDDALPALPVRHGSGAGNRSTAVEGPLSPPQRGRSPGMRSPPLTRPPSPQPDAEGLVTMQHITLLAGRISALERAQADSAKVQTDAVKEKREPESQFRSFNTGLEDIRSEVVYYN